MNQQNQSDGQGDIRISISSRDNWLEARMEAGDGGRGGIRPAMRVENWSGTKREELVAWIASTLGHLPTVTSPKTSIAMVPSVPSAQPFVLESSRIDIPGGDSLDMEFVDLTLQEAESSPGSLTRVIEASGRLRVYADSSDEGAAPPQFQVEFVLVNLDSGATQTAALEQGDIQPGEWAREIRRSFPIPGKGRYQVRAIVKNAPSGAVLAESSGPTLRVVD